MREEIYEGDLFRWLSSYESSLGPCTKYCNRPCKEGSSVLPQFGGKLPRETCAVHRMQKNACFFLLGFDGASLNLCVFVYTCVMCICHVRSASRGYRMSNVEHHALPLHCNFRVDRGQQSLSIHQRYWK